MYKRQGPLGPANLVVAGAWFLTREAELSGASARHVVISPGSDGTRPSVSWTLPSSKTDSAALGVARSHGCCRPDVSCPTLHFPVHALWDQLWLLRARFPEKWDGDRPLASLPLFPVIDGSACGKDGVVETLKAAAQALEVPLSNGDGSERISGHSLRTTGAQGLARLGLELWAIQLLGRWGSDTTSWAEKAMCNLPN